MQPDLHSCVARLTQACGFACTVAFVEKDKNKKI